MGKKFERLIVHVGMHKTGSTTLQEVFSKMRGGDAAPMDMVDVNHTLPCNLWFGPLLEQPDTLLTLGHTPRTAERHLAKVKRRVAKQLKTSTSRELLISAEWLSAGAIPGQGRDAVLNRLKEEFEPHFERMEIYGYVRPPVGYMTSAAQQVMKAKPVFQPVWPGYKRRFGPLIRVFGRDHVHMRLFDTWQLLNGDVVADFHDWVGWPQPAATVPPKNTTLNAASAALVNCYQRNRAPITTRHQNRARHRVVARLAKVEGPRFAVAPEVTRSLVEENQEDLAWMEKKLGQAIDDSAKPLPDGSMAFGSVDDLKRAAAQFAPLLRGDKPITPPDDPEAADALAWQAIRAKFRL